MLLEKLIPGELYRIKPIKNASMKDYLFFTHRIVGHAGISDYKVATFCHTLLYCGVGRHPGRRMAVNSCHRFLFQSEFLYVEIFDEHMVEIKLMSAPIT